jgi:hypothetical protein
MLPARTRGLWFGGVHQLRRIAAAQVGETPDADRHALPLGISLDPIRRSDAVVDPISD